MAFEMFDEVYDALADYAEGRGVSSEVAVQALAALAISSSINLLARTIADKEVLTVVNE